MFFLEDLKVLLLWLIATVVAVNLLFLCSVLYRRLARQRYFLAKDAAAEHYRPVVGAFLAGGLTQEQAGDALGVARSRAEKAAVVESLLARLPEAPPEVTRLLLILGYVERWARGAFGRFYGRKVLAHALRGEGPPPARPLWHSCLPGLRSLKVLAVPRALAVERLGRLEVRLAREFLAEALRDPSAEVRRLAVVRLGEQREPRAIPLLLEEMRKAVEENSDVSLRTAKGALTAYPMQHLEHFLPLISHVDPRMRFVVVDTIREICNRAAGRGGLDHRAFPPRLYEALLGRAEDASADVRARVAGVIRHFHDRRGLAALRTLLRDESEFVRLHAVRAAADPFYRELRSDLAERLRDVRWRVREAAARSLAAGGAGGTSELYRHFLASSDRYASEQMADEMQRAGAVADLVSALAAGGEPADLARAVAHKLTAMDKTSLLRAAALSAATPPAVRLALLEVLATRPGKEFVALLQTLAEKESGPVRQKALGLLRRVAEPAAVLAVGASGAGAPAEQGTA